MTEKTNIESLIKLLGILEVENPEDIAKVIYGSDWLFKHERRTVLGFLKGAIEGLSE